MKENPKFIKILPIIYQDLTVSNEGNSDNFPSIKY